MDISSYHRPQQQISPRLELLECRDVPATFGVPWADPGHLTISFAPDGTQIAGEQSTLFQTLDAQMPRAIWQGEILRAFQAWTGRAGINLGVVADDGSPFGAAGQSQHDPRFGDIRIGAHPMAPDALAISVPNDPSMTGTWTGDLLINSTDGFDPSHLDLFDVVLHEAGHVFGLGESPDPKSPLFGSYAGNSTLTSGDIKNIQSLYGYRPADANEGSSGNETIARATTIQAPGSFEGKTPLVAFGDINGVADTDVYALRPPLSNYQGGVTIRLQTTGISLLAPHLVVVDARGGILGEAQGSGTMGSTLTVHLDRVSASSTYYLKVSGVASDAFGFGNYGLAATFDATSTTSAASLDGMLRQDGQRLAPNDIATLFREPSGPFYNDDHHTDDTPGSATVLTPSPTYSRLDHYQAIGSLSDAGDVDYYRIKTVQSASGTANVLTLRLRAVSPNGVLPRATIFDSDGGVLKTTILANGDGQFVLQAVGFKGGGNFTIRVAGASATALTGNYGLDADFGGIPAALTTFTAGVSSPDRATVGTNLYIARPQLFQFLLAVDLPAGATLPAGSGMRMVIANASGRIVLDHFAGAGDVTSAPAVLLEPGAYTVRYSVVAPDGNPPALAFRLLGEAISDPLGPAVQNPVLTPIYVNPTNPGTYLYPNAVASPLPFWIGAIPI